MKHVHTAVSALAAALCMSTTAAHCQQGTCLPDKFINSFHNSDSTLDIAVKGNYAYITNTFISTGLDIFDISDPHNPVQVASGPGGHYSVHIEGNLLYAASPRSISIADISDPTQPQTVGSYSASTTVNPLSYNLSNPFAISDNIAMVIGANASTVEFIDVSDPTTPAVVGALEIGTSISGLSAGNNVAYVTPGFGATGLIAIDISDPATPSVIGIIEPTANWGSTLVDGTTLYGWNDIGELVAMDVTNPAAPVLLGSKSGVGSPLRLHGNKLVVGGVSIVDVSDPADLRIEQQFAPLGGLVTGAAINDTTAFVANVRAGIFMFDITSAQADIPERVFSTTISGNMAVNGTIGYEAAGSLGLRVHDLTNPLAPALLGSYDTPGVAVSVANVGSTAFVCDTSGGLQIIDATDPSNPLYVADIALEVSTGNAGKSIDIEVVADTAFVAVKSASGFGVPSRIAAVDISTPASPIEIGSVNVDGEVGYIDSNGNTLVASFFGIGPKGELFGVLAVFDITDPTAIVTGDTASSEGFGKPVGAYAFENTGVLVLAGPASKIVSYNTTNILNISETDRIETGGSFWYGAPHFNNFEIRSSGRANGFVYVGMNSNRLAVIDVSQPTDLTFRGAYPLPGDLSQMARVGSKLLVTVGSNLYSIEAEACNPTCLPDVNGDGAVTPDDFTAWINAFNNNLPECDQNGDGSCTPSDFTAWINNFNAGCP